MSDEIIRQIAALRKLITAKPEIVYGTVTQVSPLRVRLDGDSVALPYTPPITCDPSGFVLDARVLCIKRGSERVVTAITGGGCNCAIGDLYFTTRTTAPGTRWPGTTWEAYGAGRVPVGYDATQTEFDTIGETGGAKTHTLTTAEIPAHAHLFDLEGTADLGSAPYSPAPGTGTLYKNYVTTTESGGGGAHNNLQPYVVVYIWRRTA